MYKIYSRRRFLIKPNLRGSFSNKPKIKSTTKKIIIIILVVLLIFKLILSYIEPIFDTLCEEKIKSVATIITNQESTYIMNKYQYEELYSVEKDENGNIVIIRSNVVPINNMVSELTKNIQDEFNNIKDSSIRIAMGGLSGIYFLSGTGPQISVKVSMTGTVDTEIKSEFISQGINQTLHRVYVNFNCNMKVVTPIRSYSKSTVNQVIIAEHMIVGNIPDTYYNLEGMETPGDTLNVVQ